MASSVCLWIWYGARSVHFTVPSSKKREEVHSSSWGHRCTHSAHSPKRFKPLSATMLLWQGHCWIGKNTNKVLNCVYDACNLTKRHFEIPICFWFQLMSLSNLFLKFVKFLVLYLGCGFMNFNFKWLCITSDARWWIKNLSAKTTKYILKCWERSVKRKSNLSSISVTKNSSFDLRFLYVYGKNLSKTFSVTISCSSLAQNFSLLAV